MNFKYLLTGNTEKFRSALWICLLTLIFGLNSWDSGLKAQIYEPEGLNMPGLWNSWTNPPTNNLALASATQVTDGRVTKINVGTTRWQTIFSVAATGADILPGTYAWLFTSGPEATPFNNKWSGVTVSMNSLQTYTYQSSTDNSATLVANKWYTMNWEDLGYANTRAIFMQTSAEPVEILTVSTPTNVQPNQAVTINITTDQIKSAEELLYIRYTSTGWNTSSLAPISMNGTSGIANIPGQDAGSTVEYYALSTTVSGITADYDLYTIRYNNNADENYTYTVEGTQPAEIGWANLQWPGTGNIEPLQEFNVYAQVYVEGITDQTGQGAGIQAWIGYSLTNSNPTTWTNWVLADFSMDAGNNDEYLANIGAAITENGTYYYASRFKLDDQSYVYGGFSEAGGGFWDGTANISGVLNVLDLPDPVIGWVNLQYPDTGSTPLGQDYLVYAQVYAANITPGEGQGADIQAWIGYSTENTDPSTWTNWVPSSYNLSSGDNDEYLANLGSAITETGEYYYASRFQLLDQEYVYGGFNETGGGFWDGTINVSGLLTVTEPLETFAVNFTVTDATQTYTNLKFKGQMTNWDTVAMTNNNHIWTLTLPVPAGNWEWGVIEADGSPDGIWLIEGNNLLVSVAGDGTITGDTTYTVTFVGLNEMNQSSRFYPNPFSDQLKIETNEASEAVLLDQAGRIIWMQSLNAGKFSLPTSSLSKGTYVFRLKTTKTVYNQILIRQ
ncbi:MAG: T9SS type A sorting domain-containing protein [Bacteroidales bacterium]